MEFTIEKLTEAKNHCSLLTLGKLTKLSYACKKTIDKINLALSSHEERMNDKRISLAITGNNGEIITDGKGGYTFTPENLKKLNQFYAEEKKKMVEYEPFISSNYEEIKDNIHALDALNGIVIEVNIEDLIP